MKKNHSGTISWTNFARIVFDSTLTLFLWLALLLAWDVVRGTNRQVQVTANSVACYREGRLTGHRYGYAVCSTGNETWHPRATERP